MKYQMAKIEVSRFEQKTSYCPLYLAWRILDEARDYFRTPIPEAFADKLAHRAEAVFARHPFWQRKFSASAKASARQAILTSMRHWLAGVLAKERPALFRQLPESFKVGHPLWHGKYHLYTATDPPMDSTPHLFHQQSGDHLPLYLAGKIKNHEKSNRLDLYE